MSLQKKKWGQVFLHDSNIIDKIVRHANIQPNETILEVGVGKGILTEKLAPLARSLWLVELDPEWLAVTMEKVGHYDHIVPHQMDVLAFDMSQIPEGCKIVANIPYYISAKLIQHMIGHRHAINGMTIMVQKEFAQKLLAKPSTKNYGSLSVFFQHYVDVTSTFEVSRNCFYPKPKIDSWVITGTMKPDNQIYDHPKFESFVRAVFHHRRKSIRNNLMIAYPEQPSERWACEVGGRRLDRVRADSLDITALIEIFDYLVQDGDW